MIARLWSGKVRSEQADEYATYLQRTGLNDYRTTPGNRGGWMLRRSEGGTTEFLLVTLWESYDAIRAFAGEDFTRAVYYPEDDAYLLERTHTVDHYEVEDSW